jgi:hypothetical protein
LGSEASHGDSANGIGFGGRRHEHFQCSSRRRHASLSRADGPTSKPLALRFESLFAGPSGMDEVGNPTFAAGPSDLDGSVHGGHQALSK